MGTSSFVGLTLVCVPIFAFFIYRARKAAQMTGPKRLLGFAFFLAVGLFVLSYAHEALLTGHTPCGRRGRLDCSVDSEPFLFWAMFLFSFTGGTTGLACAVVALIRPDSAGDSA